MDLIYLRVLNIINIKWAIDKGDRQKLKDDKAYLSSILAMSIYQAEISKNPHKKDKAKEKLISGIYQSFAFENFDLLNKDNHIYILLENYKNMVYDVNDKSKVVTQLKTFENSILCFKDLISHIEFNKDLQEKYHTITDYIINNILHGNYQKYNPLLKVLNATKMNIVLPYKNGTFYYPFIIDILLDSYRLWCSYEKDKSIIDAFRSIYPAVKQSQKEYKAIYDYKFIDKIDFQELVHRTYVEHYLLAVYQEVLACEYNDIRSLYKQLTESYLQNKKNKFKYKMDISHIPPRIYLRHFSSLVK